MYRSSHAAAAAASIAPAVFFYKLAIGEGRLWILVEILHVGVRRRTVEVVVALFDVLTVVAFIAGKAE